MWYGNLSENHRRHRSWVTQQPGGCYRKDGEAVDAANEIPNMIISRRMSRAAAYDAVASVLLAIVVQSYGRDVLGEMKKPPEAPSGSATISRAAEPRE